jgi:hypothetical protein
LEKERPADGTAPGTENPAATPYEPPGIEWEEAVDVHVNLASACGQHPLEGGTCQGNEQS